MKNYILIIFIGVLVIILFNPKYIENFNNLEAKRALYNNPTQCPFDYIRMYQNNDKFVIETKIKGKPKSLNLIFDTIDSFDEAWQQMVNRFPNLNFCGNPYYEYLKNIRNYYLQQKYVIQTIETTTPIYITETFQSNPTINVRKLNRETDNQSQLSTNQYMIPNTPYLPDILRTHIDTSVQPHNDIIPPIYSDKKIQLLKQQMLDSQFDQQREYYRNILQLRHEIERLRREMEILRNYKLHY